MGDDGRQLPHGEWRTHRTEIQRIQNHGMIAAEVIATSKPRHLELVGIEQQRITQDDGEPQTGQNPACTFISRLSFRHLRRLPG